MTYPMSAAIVGVVLAALIMLLLRRDQLYLRDAMFWLGTAAISLASAILISKANFDVFAKASFACGHMTKSFPQIM